MVNDIHFILFGNNNYLVYLRHDELRLIRGKECKRNCRRKFKKKIVIKKINGIIKNVGI